MKCSGNVQYLKHTAKDRKCTNIDNINILVLGLDFSSSSSMLNVQENINVCAGNVWFLNS